MLLRTPIVIHTPLSSCDPPSF